MASRSIDVCRIDAHRLDTYRLNRLVKEKVGEGYTHIQLVNVAGQRYIAAGLQAKVTIEVFGTAGNDLGVFMDGPTLIVHGNVQDGCGNTMNDGVIVVHGDAGDIAGYGMRGGRIMIRGDVGYRAGVHMKEYGEKKPILLIGGSAQDFLGEYMAGGVIVAMANSRETAAGRFVATGMHGGLIYMRGKAVSLSSEAELAEMGSEDMVFISRLIKEYTATFKTDLTEAQGTGFVKIKPTTSRPFGRLYAH